MEVPKSSDYWRKREEENLKASRKSEAEYEKAINDTYKYMLDQIQKEINGFYAKYARAEGITLSEAKRRVSKLDIEEYGRKAARYVKTKDFSKQANDEMRLYNATMKINRLELLKANIGLELVAGFDELQKYFEEKLTNRTMDEFKRQSGILGRTVQNNEKAAHAIVNASFKNATYSDRIWMYQGMLKAELDSLLKTGLIQGKHPTELARHLQKRFGVSAYNANRLMVTELARVQTEAQKQSFIRNGFTQYTFLAIGTACEACRALNEKHFDIDKMMPGENAPPMHPNCRCSVAAYMDSEEYEEWIETYKEHGMSFEEWKQRSPVANTGSYEKAFYTKDDPIREYIGAAEKSHPQELREMKEDMERSGVDITRRAGAMGYFPGLSAGKVGNINIEEGASISAWMHEYKHFCDDREDGYLGFRVFQDSAKCAERERRAYQVEIDFAKERGYNDIVERLKKLRDEEVEKYE